MVERLHKLLLELMLELNRDEEAECAEFPTLSTKEREFLAQWLAKRLGQKFKKIWWRTS